MTSGDGPREARLLEEAKAILPRGLGIAHPVFVTHAKGTEVWDVGGRRYLDFVAGIGTLNTGHNHDRVVEAARAQIERFTHTAFQVAMYEPYLLLATRLAEQAPVGGDRKAVFFTTGAEAVENACKIARAATGRPAIVSFTSGFHGRTNLGLALTGKSRPYKQSFGPFTPEVYHSPFPDEYRGVDSASALGRLEELFRTSVDAERVAAIIIEPVAGEGGFLPAPDEFLSGLRRLADRHGIVLIADEIQTGFGRTGKMFAIEHAGVQADLVCMAKSMAGGFPLSGVVGRAELMDAPEPGGLGGTYGGNPIACAAGLAVLRVLEEERLLERSSAIGKRLREAATGWRERYDTVGDVRGRGAMVAIEFVRDGRPDAPRTELVDSLLTAARERGLLLFKAGMHGNVIRFLPPLVVTDSELDEGIGILDEVLAFEHDRLRTRT